MTNFKKLRQMIEVNGNGNIVSKEIKVSSFLRLHLSGKGLIEIHQSNEEKVVVETDENLLEYFDFANSGRTLYVTAGGNIRKPIFTKCVIKVYLRQINVLYIRNDKADVVCPNEIVLSEPLKIIIQSVGRTELNINAPEINLVSQCEGDVIIKGKCNIIKIKNQSEGNFDASGLIAEELTIKNMAEGNVDLFANKSINISHYGEGYVHYAGNGTLKDVKQYGDGEIKFMPQHQL
jgi:hypothetical protein